MVDGPAYVPVDCHTVAPLIVPWFVAFVTVKPVGSVGEVASGLPPDTVMMNEDPHAKAAASANSDARRTTGHQLVS